MTNGSAAPAGADQRFDVFLSVAGPDRPAVRALRTALSSAGLRVFLDEENIQPYQPITAEIEGALRNSRTLLAYYSRHFTSRPACQYELMAAFLAGHREGDPTRRIMVVNPHEEVDHLLPVELAEDKFDRLPAPYDAVSMARVVARIKAKVVGVEGYIGGVRSVEAPRWYGRIPGAYEFIGRYRELWAVHSALHRHEFGLTQNVSSGAVAVLSGLPGIGKSELAAAYGWHFGAAYLGGVYWVSLSGSGPGPDEVGARFVGAIRSLARRGGLGFGDTAGDDVIGRFAEHINTVAEPSLLIVDDVPGELNARLIERLLVPAGDRLYTVLVTNRAALDVPAQLVEVGTMSFADSVDLLRRYRPGSDAEIYPLAQRLGGNPMALKLAGQQLRDREGLLTHAELLARIDRGSAMLRPVTALLRDRITALDGPPRQALYLSMVCATTALPVVLLERVLGRADAEAAVAALRHQLIAARLDTAWQVHTLVRDAAREFLPPPDSAALARTAAAAILDLSEPDPAAATQLMLHAGHLSARADLPPEVRDALLRRVADHYDARGEPVLALPFHTRLAALHGDDPAVLAAAARCCQLAGAWNEAYDYATRALAVVADPALCRSCLRWAATALDALGDFGRADPIWTELLADPGTDRVDLELAYTHGLRLRGRHAEAKQRLAILAAEIGDDPALFHEAQTAQLELARVEIDTDSQIAARRRVAAVLRAYHQRELAYHRNAIEAGRVFADARLTLSLWDVGTDPSEWRIAAQDMRELRDWYAATHGPRNPLTLTTAVDHTLALIALGKPGEARRAVEAVQDDLLGRLGDRHPSYFQAQMVLGYAAAQCGRNDEARNYFTVAYQGQRALLGPTHPYTLRSQLGLGIALKLTGNSAAARQMIGEVRRAAPASIGRSTDMYWQSHHRLAAATPAVQPVAAVRCASETGGRLLTRPGDVDNQPSEQQLLVGERARFVPGDRRQAAVGLTNPAHSVRWPSPEALSPRHRDGRRRVPVARNEGRTAPSEPCVVTLSSSCPKRRGRLSSTHAHLF